MKIAALHTSELDGNASRDGDLVLLVFSGNADSRADTQLETFLQGVHEELLGESIRQVDVDIRTLEFLNSSCFKGFITWIVRVRRMNPESRYQIRFISSANYPWQKRSLHAISFFGGGDLITVSIED